MRQNYTKLACVGCRKSADVSTQFSEVHASSYLESKSGKNGAIKRSRYRRAGIYIYRRMCKSMSVCRYVCKVDHLYVA